VDGLSWLSEGIDSNNIINTNSKMDYDAVRAAADGSANMRRVEVNQRALIDKILARYATASAVYRELLQNSNDASATVRLLQLLFRRMRVFLVVFSRDGMHFQ
jgi:hypothetical protein